jgi:hypothetical protein
MGFKIMGLTMSLKSDGRQGIFVLGAIGTSLVTQSYYVGVGWLQHVSGTGP